MISVSTILFSTELSRVRAPQKSVLPWKQCKALGKQSKSSFSKSSFPDLWMLTKSCPNVGICSRNSAETGKTYGTLIYLNSILSLQLWDSIENQQPGSYDSCWKATSLAASGGGKCLQFLPTLFLEISCLVVSWNSPLWEHYLIGLRAYSCKQWYPQSIFGKIIRVNYLTL